MVVVRPFEPRDAAGVVDLILPIQREEFGFDVTLDDQPDLKDVPGFYETGAGGFWVAEAAGRVVGSIALKDIGNGQGALRKMFVAATHRGAEGVARRLLDALFAHADAHGIRAVFLGTTERFLAAHRFYEKHGFARIGAEDLPATFPRMHVDTRFYVRRR